MSSKDWLRRYIEGLSIDEAEELAEIIDLLEMDPGILYHELSKYKTKWRVLKPRWSRMSRPSLLKEVEGEVTKLPEPNTIKISIDDVLRQRRSIRDYRPTPITLKELSTLLYYSAGIKGYDWGYPKRMFPSAGALQPLEIYVHANMIEDLEKGIYHYQPKKHILVSYKKGDFARELYLYSLQQEHVYEAAANLLITVVYSRTYSKYGYRAYRYINLDLGHLGQNIYLVATALGLGTCAVGAFEDDPINRLLNIDGREEFIGMIYPIGKI
jgi:SagB-type dehydrogenase family enzyme